VLVSNGTQAAAVWTVIDVDLRDVPIVAHNAEPRTTMRRDRARNNLDRYAN